MQGQAYIFDWLSVGANASIIAFLSKKRSLRLQTDTTQSGLIVLERGYADVSKGAIWNIGAYAGLHTWSRSISLIGGYSVAVHEKTRIGVKDSTFLSTFIAAQTSVEKENKDSIVNQDNRFKLREIHTINLMLSYDGGEHTRFAFAPYI